MRHIQIAEGEWISIFSIKGSIGALESRKARVRCASAKVIGREHRFSPEGHRKRAPSIRLRGIDRASATRV
jgi:hypothetical protein